MKTNKYFFLVLILLLSIFIKTIALNNNEKAIDADEALIGIMANHILAGKITPVFVYGQDYMGSIEGYTSALFFKFFGHSVSVLKSVPLFYSILNILLTFFITQYLFQNNRISFLSSIIMALPSYLLIKWCLSTTGGHIENIFFSQLIILLYFIYLETKKKYIMYICGFFAGVSFWNNPFALFIIIPMFIFYLFEYRKNKKQLLLFSLFFVIGLTPMIIYNIKNEFITFKKLAGFFLGVSKSEYNNNVNFLLLIFVKIKNIIIRFPVGLYKLNKLFILKLGDYYIIGFLYWISILYFLKETIRKTNKKYWFIFFSIILFTIVLSLSKRATRPRYLLVYWIFIPSLTSYFIYRIFYKIKFIVILLLIVTNVFMIYQNNNKQFINNFYNNYEEIIRFLNDNKINYLYTDMYIAYPLSFLSSEKIICSPAAGFYNEDRIKEYTKRVKKQKQLNFVFIKNSNSFKQLRSALLKNKINYKLKKIKDYYIVYDLSKNINIDKLHLPKRFK